MTDHVEFQQIVWDYYHAHGRDLPWRHAEPDGTFDPYKVMVSEIMLQQTQAARVIPKYHEFLALFPDTRTLAEASLSTVLAAWSGLGYNRRAKFLLLAAQQIDDVFPDTVEELVKLPGIGKNTAAAIVAYSFNKPVTFIETNIRSVYIHHFFADRTDVDDKELLPLIAATLPWDEGKEQPETRIHSEPGAMRKTVGLSHVREWYWALMDYGVHIKAVVGNTARNSKHYAKQSTFQGSKRQVRGQVIRLLTTGPMSSAEMATNITDERLTTVLSDLINEGLIQEDSDAYRLC